MMRMILRTKQLLPSDISYDKQENQHTPCCNTSNKDFKYPMSIVQCTMDVHTKPPCYQSFNSYSERCNGQCQLKLNEFISLVVKLDIDIIFCIINIFTNLQTQQRK